MIDMTINILYNMLNNLSINRKEALCFETVSYTHLEVLTVYNFYVGLDLGQAQDYTALTIIERKHFNYSLPREQYLSLIHI